MSQFGSLLVGSLFRSRHPPKRNHRVMEVLAIGFINANDGWDQGLSLSAMHASRFAVVYASITLGLGTNMSNSQYARISGSLR